MMLIQLVKVLNQGLKVLIQPVKTLNQEPKTLIQVRVPAAEIILINQMGYKIV